MNQLKHQSFVHKWLAKKMWKLELKLMKESINTKLTTGPPEGPFQFGIETHEKTN